MVNLCCVHFNIQKGTPLSKGVTTTLPIINNQKCLLWNVKYNTQILIIGTYASKHSTCYLSREVYQIAVLTLKLELKSL